MKFTDVKTIEEHIFDTRAVEIAVQDRRGTLWLIAVSSDADADECVFYQGVPQGDDGISDTSGSGWLKDGVMTDGPSWPLTLLSSTESSAQGGTT